MCAFSGAGALEKSWPMNRCVHLSMPKSLKKTATSAGSPRSTPSKRDAAWGCGADPPKHRVVEIEQGKKGNEHHDNSSTEYSKRRESVARAFRLWSVRLARLHSSKSDYEWRAEAAGYRGRLEGRDLESIHFRKRHRRQHGL